MKIILDLSKSYDNYNWQNEEELKNYILDMKKTLWNLHNENLIFHKENETNKKLYDILDMFENFKIEKESDK